MMLRDISDPVSKLGLHRIVFRIRNCSLCDLLKHIQFFPYNYCGEMVAGTGTNYLDGLPSGVEQAHTTLPAAQPEQDGIWLRILQEVSAKNNNAVQSSLIILGT
jgi:hypothetical protein